jgi:hypothetical protein
MKVFGWALFARVMLFMFCGCAGGGDGKPDGIGAPTPPTPVQLAPAMATAPATSPAFDRDQITIEAALGDLLTLTDSPLDVRGQPPAEIKFAPRASTYPVKVSQILMRRDKAKWDALSKEQLDAGTEAAEDIARRNYAADGFKPFQPRDPRIKLDDGAPEPGRNLRFDRPVHAYPPGYSADRNYAIVFLSIPWSMQHADGTYLLARDGAGWRVILRQFVYYV